MTALLKFVDGGDFFAGVRFLVRVIV